MPLNVTNIDVPLGAGLDQKSDQHSLAPGKVTGLTNCVFTKLGAIQKRSGNRSFATGSLVSGSSGMTLSTAPVMQQLATFRDQLVGIDSTSSELWSLSPTADAWVDSGPVPSCFATRQTIASAPSAYASPDIAYLNGFLIYVWLSDMTISGNVLSTGNLYVTVVDAVTKVPVLRATQVARTVINPKLTVVGQTVCLTYLSFNAGASTAAFAQVNITGVGQNLVPKLGSIITGQVPGAVTGADPAPFFCYDICTDDTNLFLTYTSDTISGGSGHGFLLVFVLNPTTGAMVAWSGIDTGTAGPNIISIGSDCSVDFVVGVGLVSFLNIAYGVSSTGPATNHVKVLQVLWNFGGSTFVTAYGPTEIYSALGSLGNTFASYIGVANRDAYNFVITFYNALNDTGPRGNPTLGEDQALAHAQMVNVNIFGTITTVGPPRLNYFIGGLSKPFWVTDPSVPGGARAYVFGTNDAALMPGQGTEYLFDVGAHDTTSPFRQWRPVATVSPRLSNGNGGSIFNSLGVLANTATDRAGKRFAIGSINNDSTTFGKLSLQLCTFDFNAMEQFQASELGENLHLGAGVPTFFDGINTGEIGFHYYPPIQSDYIFPSGSGGNVATGSYVYAVTYEYYDARGQLHQSAPSPPIFVDPTITIGKACTGSIELWIPNLCITNRNTIPVSGSSIFPQAVIWRSTNGSNILHRLTPINGPSELICNPTASNLIYVDRASDAGLDTQPLLYTDGGVLANFMPPSSRLVCSHQERLWISGQDNPKAVWFSQEATEGSATRFNDSLAFVVDDGGDITALKGMDDKLVVFKSDRLFYVAGAPPNELGFQGNLSLPIPIPSDVGCTNPRSVVLTPDGIIFQSELGIMLLSRNLQVSPLGFPVEDLLRQFPNITSAVIHPDQYQVRFTCLPGAIAGIYTPGITLVYDYLARAWTSSVITDPLHNVTGSAMTTATVHAGAYKQSSAFGFPGNATGCSLREDTSGLSGSFGDGTNYVPMKVESAWVATNGIQGFQRVRHVSIVGEQLDNCDVKVSLAFDYSDTYTQSQTFSSSLLNGPGNIFQVDLHVDLNKQKCQAIRVKVEDSAPSSGSYTTGQGISLTRITLRAGTKMGTQRLPPTNRG